ncbi:hypothetical protein CBM2599_A90084 [Cupriavidus taiwanensis]|nr:hypothetical protein CBM2600_A100086 [Cupriavidus taiwanensis]SOY92136.1 hypothetical protein CBM2599_A90084 [Cupriavidus taiwanensis]
MLVSCWDLPRNSGIRAGIPRCHGPGLWLAPCAVLGFNGPAAIVSARPRRAASRSSRKNLPRGTMGRTFRGYLGLPGVGNIWHHTKIERSFTIRTCPDADAAPALLREAGAGFAPHHALCLSYRLPHPPRRACRPVRWTRRWPRCWP